MKRTAALLAPAVLALAACGGGTTHPPGPPVNTGTDRSVGGVGLSTAAVPGRDSVLVNAQGQSLYTFALDKAKKVTCTGSCAQVWRPLRLVPGQKPSVSGGVKASLVSSVPDPSGGRVVTYAGWPLYTYKGDQAAGSDHGQAVYSNGGFWYLMDPSGKPITSRHLPKGKY